MKKFKVTFYGVRGSYPVPGDHTLKIGGNTSCVELNINDNIIIFDAGTGIINLGNELVKRHFETQKPIHASLFFSHMHHDHNQGFPFFKPAYLGSSTLYVFGPIMFEKDLEKLLSKTMLPPFFPVTLQELNSMKVIHNLKGSEEIYINATTGKPKIRDIYHDEKIPEEHLIKISVIRDYAHPVNGVLFYRVDWCDKRVVYATDTEGYVGGNQKLINFAKNADILIHDAQYFMDAEYADTNLPRQGFGHSTPEMAAEVAEKANVKKLILFHHDPAHSDEKILLKEQEIQKVFPNTIAAYEGLEIDL
jgi:phosphoribosyl 1,2-cyclic phosphodiesterase